MNMLTGVWDWFKGKKTYTIVGVYVLAILVEKGLGFDIPNFTPGPDWMSDLMLMFGIGTARSAIGRV